MCASRPSESKAEIDLLIAAAHRLREKDTLWQWAYSGIRNKELRGLVIAL